MFEKFRSLVSENTPIQRGTYSIQDICKWSSKREFNNVIIVGEAKRGELRAKEFRMFLLLLLLCCCCWVTFVF